MEEGSESVLFNPRSDFKWHYIYTELGKFVHAVKAKRNTKSLAHLFCYSLAFLSTTKIGAWWLIGRFVAFRPKGRGFESGSSRRVGTFGKSLYSQLPVALRRETPTQYSGCVWSASEY